MTYYIENAKKSDLTYLYDISNLLFQNKGQIEKGKMFDKIELYEWKNKEYMNNIFSITEQFLDRYKFSHKKIYPKTNNSGEEIKGSIEFYKCIRKKTSNNIHDFNEPHQDSCNGKCNTVIYYLDISETVNDGKLVICKNENCNSIIEKVDIKGVDDNHIKVVILSGEQYHYVENINGYGNRNVLVVQMYCD